MLHLNSIRMGWVLASWALAVLPGSVAYGNRAQVRQSNDQASTNKHSAQDRRFYPAEESLTFQFAIPNGSLILGYTEPFTDPAIPRLAYKEGSRETLLYSLKDLAGRVRLDSDRSALSFVRLRTSPVTFHMFEDDSHLREMEVMNASRITPDFVFGDTDKAKSLKTYHSGHAGVVNAGIAAQLGLPAAKVRRVKEGFEIQRLLVQRKILQTKTRPGYEEMYVVNTVIERVGTDGSYKVLRRTPFQPPKGWWFRWGFPTFK